MASLMWQDPVQRLVVSFRMTGLTIRNRQPMLHNALVKIHQQKVVPHQVIILLSMELFLIDNVSQILFGLKRDSVLVHKTYLFLGANLYLSPNYSKAGYVGSISNQFF